MKVPKKLNIYRRKLMRLISQNIATSSRGKQIMLSPEEVKHVLVCRPNHRLGNLLLMTPLIQVIGSDFPNCKIDVFAKGYLASEIFKNYENVDKLILLPKKHFKQPLRYLSAWVKLRKKKYDLVVNVEGGSSSGRLATKRARAKYKFFGDSSETTVSKNPHIAKYPVINYHTFLRQSGLLPHRAAIPSLNLKLSDQERLAGKKILSSITGNDQKTICIFTYATGDKCYAPAWWMLFYEKLILKFPQYNIVEVLPIENVSQIAFSAPSFYSKDIREIASVISNSVLFIGADSGMMHLASASQTSVIGLFSVSSLAKYSPYDNDSLGIDTNINTADDILTAIKYILEKGY